MDLFFGSGSRFSGEYIFSIPSSCAASSTETSCCSFQIQLKGSKQQPGRCDRRELAQNGILQRRPLPSILPGLPCSGSRFPAFLAWEGTQGPGVFVRLPLACLQSLSISLSLPSSLPPSLPPSGSASFSQALSFSLPPPLSSSPGPLTAHAYPQAHERSIRHPKSPGEARPGFCKSCASQKAQSPELTNAVLLVHVALSLNEQLHDLGCCSSTYPEARM